MSVLLLTIIGLAIAHSAANPIHYLPFVALGKARNWGLRPTVLVAAFAASGHLFGFAIAVLLGLIANKGIEFAGELMHTGADIGLILFAVFGAIYAAYGIRRALYKKNCESKCNSCNSCGHGHERIIKNADPHSMKYIALLFLMFAIGPCDAILAIVFYSSAEYSIFQLSALALAYYAATATTMAVCTALLYKGLEVFSFGGKFVDKWAHAISGAAIMLSAIAAMLMSHSH